MTSPPSAPPAPPSPLASLEDVLGPAGVPSDDYLVRVRGLLAIAIERRWVEGLLTDDEDGVFTGFLGVDQVRRLLAGTPPPPRRILPDADLDAASPLGKLVRALDLRPSEADLLALLLACETDPATMRLAVYAQGNKNNALTLDVVLDAVYGARVHERSQAAALMHRDLAPQQRLRRLRCVIVEGGGGASLGQTVRLDPRMTSWLLGHRAIDAALGGHAVLLPPAPPTGECDAEALERLVAALAAGDRLVILDGQPQTGRQLLLQFAAARLGRPLLVVQGRGLPADTMVAAFREAWLQGGLLAVRDADDALEKDGLPRFRECLEVFPGTVSLLDARSSAPLLGALRPITEVRLAVPPHAERLRLWRTYLGGGLSPVDLERTAALYNLGVGGIVAASLKAREAAAFAREPLAVRHVTQAVRRLFDSDLSAVATRVTVTQSFEDLVLPEDLQRSIEGILDRVRHRVGVLGEWGFERKLGKGLGLTVLFSGEPGTGKSMVAGLIAKELGLDLYVVDVSRVMSKWLGETEKNLARAFDAAETGHVLLLFDEADSLLGKRSGEMRGSNDRYANLETNFILARLEQFGGIAFFTTNLTSALDPAVARRMSAHVVFPFPDCPTRTRLWECLIPAETPRGEPIDFRMLAERYKLSGGFIRNIVLRAAFTARREGTGLLQRHLLEAAELEYRERGAIGTGGRLA